jgi:sugar lactone lactonase YvrE
MKSEVATYLTGSGLNRPDGFALDASGNLFVANWGGGSGRTVLKISAPDVVTTFDSTSDAPDALVFDAAGNLYISNYNSGVITKTTSAGVKTDFVSGLTNPSALAFDRDGNLYVSNFDGKTISKITPEGKSSTFASGFSAPLGLNFDSEGNLFVADYQTGIVHKVTPDQTMSVFATVPNPANSKIQYLARSPSGNLYLPSYGHNQIYRIATSGIVTVFAGTGVAGGKDGPLDEAEFDGPNSIAISANGDMYVSEYNANRIRIIRGAAL